MSEIYVPSEKIVVFPAGRRKSQNNADGAIITEERLSSLTNGLVDVGGFVISPKFDEELGTSVSVNILGRYFKITNDDGISSLFTGIGDSTEELYVGINIDEATYSVYNEIDGQDDGGYYKGLRLLYGSNFDYNGDNTYSYTEGSSTFTCVKIAEKKGDKWIIPEPQLPKVLFIDGGTIEGSPV